jgi:hypothetical protein
MTTSKNPNDLFADNSGNVLTYKTLLNAGISRVNAIKITKKLRKVGQFRGTLAKYFSEEQLQFFKDCGFLKENKAIIINRYADAYLEEKSIFDKYMV